jgi:hypothetical protein
VLGLGDDDTPAAEARQPVPLAGMIALDSVRLLLADIEPPGRDQFGVSRPGVGTVETCAPALQAFDQLGTSSSVTTAQLPVDEPPRSAIPSLPDPELVGLFLR